jgi:hypothetical protein
MGRMNPSWWCHRLFLFGLLLVRHHFSGVHVILSLEEAIFVVLSATPASRNHAGTAEMLMNPKKESSASQWIEVS